MRKLKLQMQLSLDGYAADEQGGLGWMIWDWDDELKAYADALTQPVDLILMGRKMSGDFIAHWARVAADPDDPEHDFGRRMNETPRIVFSKTVDRVEGDNVTVMGEADAERINGLKAQPGGDIIVYGGVSFVGSLFRQDLIDELHLFIHPVALGRGMSFFRDLPEWRQLQLAHARAFPCGVVALAYRRALAKVIVA